MAGLSFPGRSYQASPRAEVFYFSSHPDLPPPCRWLFSPIVSQCQKPSVPQQTYLKCQCVAFRFTRSHPLPLLQHLSTISIPSKSLNSFFMASFSDRSRSIPVLPFLQMSPELLGKHLACCYYSIPICILSHKPF